MPGENAEKLVYAIEDFRNPFRGAESTLADFIHGDSSLKCAFKAANLRISFSGMLLADTAIDPLSPQFQTASLQVPAH